jgi:hypothetical protein
MLFSTVPYKPVGSNDELARGWSPFRSSINPESFTAESESFVAAYQKAVYDIQRRVIGKALSTARPGAPFDIILGHYCV